MSVNMKTHLDLDMNVNKKKTVVEQVFLLIIFFKVFKVFNDAEIKQS